MMTPPRPAVLPRPCPPGQRRLPSSGPCAPKLTPLGGPAGGLWPAGRSGPSAPGQQCRPAHLFADCFASCSGVISLASPGPVCGWTYSDVFGGGTADFAFVPGSMTVETTGDTEFPAASRPLGSDLASVFGIAGLFDFTEYQTVPNGQTTYELIVNNVDQSQIALVGLFGDGGLIVQVGDPANAATYLGAWTPNNGAHRVYFSIDALGVPGLCIDGAPVALTSIGNVPSFGAFLPANSVAYLGGAGVAGAASNPVRDIFLTTGDPGPQSIFCCPA